jgi:predicted nuclease with RNAse H fold
MQKLTARGMRLAKMLRRYGITVIESYPGAAQDIMQIPRKHAGLPYLKDGLHEFGIKKGPWYMEKVSHDELDAITSAIVGLFYLAGKYEALGNDDEEYLVIPKL